MRNFDQDKAQATAWAQQLFDRTDWVILDTETTGLHGAEVVDVAVIDSSGLAILDSLIKPSIPVPPEASDIHGLFDADLSEAPGFPEIYEPLRDAITSQEVVIYSSGFDTRILNGVCQFHNLAKLFHQFVPNTPNQRVSCAMLAYAMWYGDWNNRKGSYKWQPLRGGNHRALGDCLATLELIKKMAASS